MAQVEVKVPDIGDFKDVAVIEVMVKPGEVIAVDTPAYGPGATHVSGIEAAIAELGTVAGGVAVLVKGSRVAALERVADALG